MNVSTSASLVYNMEKYLYLKINLELILILRLGRISCEHLIIGDALKMHASNPGATFQVASQFNCLEFTSFHQQPENGVGIYEYDGTVNVHRIPYIHIHIYMHT